MRDMINAGTVQAKQEGWFLLRLFALILALGLFVVQPVQRLYDQYLRPVPWISANLELLPPDSVDGQRIIYDVAAPVPLKGTWSAWLEVDGKSRCFGRGGGAYGPATPRNRNWPLAEWLAIPCATMAVPFRACVKYEVVTQTGAAGSFGPFCSPIYDPRGDSK